jgi:excisionase family DNA binding protein
MPAAGEAQLTGAPAPLVRRSVESMPTVTADRPICKPYRVVDVAKMLDVHIATIYRDIAAGRLRAHRVGSGKGALRILPDALNEYFALLEVRAVTEVA